MNETNFPWLTLVVFTPWIGAVVLPFLRKNAVICRWAGMAFSLSTLVFGAVLLKGFDANEGFQFAETHVWIEALNIQYNLAADGMSLLLVLLTAVVAPTALWASWKMEKMPALFNSLFLMLQGAALGVFLAQDFFLWFLFWELSLVPSFLLIRLWGGKGAAGAAYQFVIYTLGGSAFMLLAFAGIFAVTGTLDFAQLAQAGSDGTLMTQITEAAGSGWVTAAFLGVFIGLAVKVPLFPFHTWLPSAYAEAPTGASMFLTGVLSKMGVYGFFRILWPIFPLQLQAAASWLIWLALAGVVLGALSAMAQKDLKRMVAYSSVNHVSYCLLALFAVVGAKGAEDASLAAALNGSLLQMFNHGLSASALFMGVGILEVRSGGLRGLGDFGGVRAKMPVFALLCGVALFSSLGLPGLNGFVGEFMIFLGVFGVAPWMAAASCIGLLVTAIFLLTFMQKVFSGPVGERVEGFADVTGSERWAFVPVCGLMVLFGVMPQLLIGLVNPLVNSWILNLLS